MLKRVTTVIHIRDINNCKVYLGNDFPLCFINNVNFGELLSLKIQIDRLYCNRTLPSKIWV